MEVVIFEDEVAARAAIDECNARKGFPLTEDGTRFGAGRFVSSIVTESVAEPIPTKDGRWAVPAEAIDADVESRVELAAEDFVETVVEVVAIPEPG